MERLDNRQNRSRLSAFAKSKAKTRFAILCMGAVIVVVLAFLAGFILRSNVTLVSSLGIPVVELGEATTSDKAIKTTYDSLSARMSETEDILADGSMNDINLTSATRGMLGALMDSLDDPYAAYFDSERYDSYIKESSDKSYAGIGVLFGEYDGRAYAIDVLEGSQAFASGVQQGDCIVSIDGDSSHDWSVAEVVGVLDRNDGEDVVITWLRPASLDSSKGKEFITTLLCKRYTEENVTTSLDENVGYIRLRQITDNSAQLVSDAVESLTNQGAQAFVLDIRDNPGGYLTQSIDIASLFVPSGVLVNIQTRAGTNGRNANGDAITASPVVVLINEYTCASAEVLAAALQDAGSATLVGQTTMGKGSVQVLRELSFGGAIRYTAAYYLTPQKHPINDVGVAPNMSVGGGGPGSEDDSQLAVGMDIARTRIAETSR